MSGPEPLGVALTAQGANVAVFSDHAESVAFCLFDEQNREIFRAKLPERTGPVFHGHFDHVSAGARYGFRADGPWRPEAGLYFNPQKLLLDPFALNIDRIPKLHPSFFPESAEDSGPFAPKSVLVAPRPAVTKNPKIPWRDTVIYEAHVRGFTKTLLAVPEAQRGTFAGLAHPAAIAHLKHLGVTTLELLPCAAFIDERHLVAKNLSNYWGYNPILFGAPDPRLAPGGFDEIASAVDALHRENIEVLIDVVLNHSGEGDEHGPILSLRGLDNPSFYRLSSENPAKFVNDAGCGNILRLDHPATLRLAMESLRAWALYGGVDGFRFDLATTLGRRDTGFDPHAPLLAAIAQDPILRDRKLIAEPWDIGPGGYRIGEFPAAWGEWNDKFRDDVKRFWRGDAGRLGGFATRLTGSSDVFQRKKPASRSINFIVAHDGFTLKDLVSYGKKHNQANGEDNRDGADENFSWNHGVEGESSDEAIRNARARDQRNLMATLFFARGTPMLAMGAELGHSQNGNNNAYAQDNATSWLDWRAADKNLLAFTRRALALRADQSALRSENFLTGAPPAGETLPDVEWRAPNGAPLSPQNWSDPENRTLAAIFSTKDSRVALLVNAGAEPQNFVLPPPRDARIWTVALDSATPDGAPGPASAQDPTECAPRSLLALIEAPAPQGAQEAPPSREKLELLARAAGIALDWHDLAGMRHQVPETTLKKLLSALGLPADSQSEAQNSLTKLAETRDRRALPLAAHAREGEILEIAFSRLPKNLEILDESNAARPIFPRENWRETRLACDGAQFVVEVARFDAPPIGRYILRDPENPEPSCALTVAPNHCYWPPDFAPASVLSAQAYSLRRDGDDGIGDFSALAELAEKAGRAGYAALAINPLHMMFAQDRERASPYQPSDRRFLDPISIDVEAAAHKLALAFSAGGDERLAASALSAREMIDYSGVWALKEKKLKRLFAQFQLTASAEGAAALQNFAGAGGASLKNFAQHEAQGRENTSPQQIIFEQWLADQQLAEVFSRGRQAGLSLGLYRDLAVGCAPDGFEATGGDTLKNFSVGAPPDPFCADGQIWGLPPENPLAMAQNGFKNFAARLRANMRHAGLLRIDHVMGLARLFVIPDGAPALEGAYLHYPLKNLLAELALESFRAQCMVVGEDLGTVPENFREILAREKIMGLKILWFERHGDDFVAPQFYPELAVACAASHDLPTLLGFCRGADIDEKLELGLLDSSQALQARIKRVAELIKLLDALKAQNLSPQPQNPDEPFDENFVAAIHQFLAKTRCALISLQLDDLSGEIFGVNLPGTDRERPNWRRRLNAMVKTLPPAPKR